MSCSHVHSTTVFILKHLRFKYITGTTCPNTLRYDGLNFTTITKVIGYLTRFNSLLEPDNEFSQTQDYLTKKNVTMEDLIHIVQHVTPSCQDILLDCKW